MRVEGFGRLNARQVYSHHSDTTIFLRLGDGSYVNKTISRDFKIRMGVAMLSYLASAPASPAMIEACFNTGCSLDDMEEYATMGLEKKLENTGSPRFKDLLSIIEREGLLSYYECLKNEKF